MGRALVFTHELGIALLVMMQGVTVKYDSSVLWYVSSLVSEVLRCAMGVASKMEHEHAAPVDTDRMVKVLYLFDVFKDTSLMIARIYGKIGLVRLVGPPSTSYNSIQFPHKPSQRCVHERYQSKKPLDDARCLGEFVKQLYRNRKQRAYRVNSPQALKTAESIQRSSQSSFSALSRFNKCLHQAVRNFLS